MRSHSVWPLPQARPRGASPAPDAAVPAAVLTPGAGLSGPTTPPARETCP
ncbi:hypothetical protein NY78_2738 [Desulfovibrio sp. TomC]|nr:hypothetical protein NY78_2738 [Desulfovibrio sp. TomC]